MNAPRQRRIYFGAASAALVVALMLGGGANWWIASPQAEPVRIVISEADLELGATLYAEHCAACHGADLEGQPDWRSRGPDGRLPAPPHDETGHTWHHGDSVLFRIVSQGTAAVVGGGYESDMPGFGDQMTDAQIQDVLAYIKSTWPERVRTYQENVTEAQ